MKILNLQAGLGGNAKLWDFKHEITAVELEPKIAAVYQANNPNHTVIVGDANQYLLDHFEEFDIIWGSPPCQTHSKMMKATRHKKPRFTDMTLYQFIIFMTHFYKGLWIIENVKPFYEPLIQPSAIIGRHYFWSNFEIDEDFELPNHKNFIQADSPQEIQSLKDWLGIQYEGNIYYGKNHSPGQVLRNCVHPKLGKHILDCALGLKRKHEYQGTMFNY